MSRRVTRSSAAAAAGLTNATPAALEALAERLATAPAPTPAPAPGTPTATAAGPSGSRPARPPKPPTALQRNTVALRELLEQPDVTAPQLEAFLAGKQESLWKYTLWRPTLQNWIQRGHWEPLYFYLNAYRTDPDSGIARMDFIGQILDHLRVHAPTEIFKDLPFWREFKEVVGTVPMVAWKQHIEKTIAAGDSAPAVAAAVADVYFRRLLTENWSIGVHTPADILAQGVNTLSQKTLQELARYMYRNLGVADVPVTNTPADHPLLTNAVFTYLENHTADITPAQIAFYTELFKAFPRNRVPLYASPLFQPPDILFGILRNLFSRSEFAETRTAFLDAFKVNKLDNALWLTKILSSMIQAGRFGRPTFSRETLRVCGEMCETIIRTQNVNVNNLYASVPPQLATSWDAFMRGLPESYRREPIFNAMTWMQGKIPLVTLAVMYGNKPMLKYLITLGAKMDRCAFNLQDLTDDPAMLKLFLPGTKATKIQRAYLTHMMNPSHPSQSRRNAAWTALATAADR